MHGGIEARRVWPMLSMSCFVFRVSRIDRATDGGGD
jgi:hypothetical protein